jgi:DNA-binding NarL/FixJ family response regulator
MPLTILVADDELGIRLSIKDYLEMKGYSVLMAENGQRALEMISQYQPHLLITDITMPQLDGYELVRLVRQQPAFRLLPVIFLTARNQTRERIQGYQTGGDLYLSKPFDLEELGVIVRSLLDRLQIIQSDWRMRLQTLEEDEPKSPAPSEQLGLTSREQEVVQLLAEGLSNAQIGDRLHLSARTIEKYVSSLLQKTAAHNRAELVRFAIDHDLISSD